MKTSFSCSDNVLKKHNIFLIGPMGAGKSTIGRQLANQLNMQFFDSDQEIEMSTGASISWVFDVEGEVRFRDREEKMIDGLTQKKGIVLATGGGSIQSCITRKNLADRGLVVYLKTAIEQQLIRTQHDKRRPLLTSKLLSGNTRELLEKLAKDRNPLYEEIAEIILSTDEQNVRIVVNKIIMLRSQNIT